MSTERIEYLSKRINELEKQRDEAEDRGVSNVAIDGRTTAFYGPAYYDKQIADRKEELRLLNRNLEGKSGLAVRYKVELDDS